MNLQKIIIAVASILCTITAFLLQKPQDYQVINNQVIDNIDNSKTTNTKTEDYNLDDCIIFESVSNNQYSQYININQTESSRVQFEIPQQPPTLYDTFTKEEINFLEVTVQHEVGNFSDDYKTLVTELIYNRLVSDEFPNTVKEVLWQKNQFCGIERWYSPDFEVDDNTKLVVKEVFSKEDTSHNATYYYNPELSNYESVVWFEYSGDVEFLFEHTEESWGIEYTTRFFK